MKCRDTGEGCSTCTCTSAAKICLLYFIVVKYRDGGRTAAALVQVQVLAPGTCKNNFVMYRGEMS